MEGREVGGYRLAERIGKGGMGVIHRAVHVETGQVVAVKMLHARLTKDEPVRERFLREAQAQARLSHPHIAGVRSLVEKEGNYYIIMEYLEGETLLRRLRRAGPLPPEEGLALFRQVLDAVAHAHSLGVLHRDLKPANVMILPKGIAKVTDFGTAKILDAETLTLAGTALGSPLYMSPEQLRGEPLDGATDVYSLGITLYQICTGAVPYEGESLAELLRQLRNDDPTPPSKHLPTLDPELEEIILRGMAKEKKKRFPTAEAMRDALDGYRKRVALASRAPDPSPREAPLSLGELLSLRVVLLTITLAVALALFLALAGRTFLAIGGLSLYVPVVIALAYIFSAPGRTPRCLRCRRPLPRGLEGCPQCTGSGSPEDLRASLVGTGSDGRPIIWPLPEGTHRVGRKPPCEIILDDREASNRHAEIRHVNGQLSIRDLGSTNGTTVNGARLEGEASTPIYNRDRIGIGRTVLTVDAEPPA